MKPEYKNLITLNLVSFLVGVVVWQTTTTITIWICSICFSVFYYIECRKRNRKIDVFVDEIDNILFGKEQWKFNNYAEGELYILQDKVSKLVVMLRERDELLLKEKRLQEQLMVDISHQLRTPLTSMNLILNVLRKEELSKMEQRMRLQELNVLTDRIEGLLRILLKMAQLDSETILLQKQPVSCKEVLLHALKPLEISMELHDITVTWHGNLDSKYIGDFTWSSEAFGNICKNCIEHMPEGGELIFSLEETVIYTKLIIEHTSTEHAMAEEELPLIFQRFYRGKHTTSSGFGIGMSLAHMVVTKQNGTIKAENRLEGGIRFIITFYHELI